MAAGLAAVTIPLHAIALRRPWPASRPVQADPAGPARGSRTVLRSRQFVLLTCALTAAALAMFAALIGLVPLLIERGASSTTAAWALGLGGVGQVAGRLGYGMLTLCAGVRARTALILGLAAATTAALALVPGPVWLLVAVAVVAGVGRGITTLLQATAVTDRWGSAEYGTLTGALSAPVTAAAAVAPWAGAALAGLLGGYPPALAALALVATVAAILAVGSRPSRMPDQ